MADALAQIGRRVERESGIHVRPDQLPSLEAAATSVTGTRRAIDALGRLGHPSHGPALMQRLLEEIAIHESFFLREADQLRSIDWAATLERAQARGVERVRVWSAGCASGEEPYSLAILAADALGEDPAISILGTDLSDQALRRAASGDYGARAIRQLDEPLLDRHFERHGDLYRVAPSLRRHVSFARHNLTRDAPPAIGAFDVVLCRNLLIYLEPAAVQRALACLRTALAADGELLLGVADRLCVPLQERHGARDPAKQRPARRRAATRQPVRIERRAAAAPHSLAEAQRLADGGRPEDAIAIASSALEQDPMDPAAHYLIGIVRLATGDGAGAVHALRAALYADAGFGLAAFQLARAHEGLGDGASALGAYERALAELDPDDRRYDILLGQVDIADVAAACRMRISALRSGGATR